jgi:hypothetical protein
MVQAQAPSGEIATADVRQLLEDARRSGAQISDQQIAESIAAVASARKRSSEMATELEPLKVQSGDAEGMTVTPLSRMVGKDGVPFPAAEDIVLKPLPTPTIGPTPTEPPVWSPEPYPAPGRCQANETKREVWNDNTSEPENRVLKDTLFVDKAIVPLEPEEAFGKSAYLVPYTMPIDSGTLMTMEIYSVPCVPYRIRMTNVAKYYDRGLNALRNYDGDARGRGKMAPIIQQKMAGSQPARTRGGR